jgi:hypothetical protein
MLVFDLPVDYFSIPKFFSRRKYLYFEESPFCKNRHENLKGVFTDAFFSAWSTCQNLASNFLQKVISIPMWTSCEQVHLARAGKKQIARERKFKSRV